VSICLYSFMNDVPTAAMTRSLQFQLRHLHSKEIIDLNLDCSQLSRPPGLELGSSKRLTFLTAGQPLEKLAHLPKTFKNGASNDNC
jgi:hypothetical protein